MDFPFYEILFSIPEDSIEDWRLQIILKQQLKELLYKLSLDYPGSLYYIKQILKGIA